jgi:hypothetical protein
MSLRGKPGDGLRLPGFHFGTSDIPHGFWLGNEENSTQGEYNDPLSDWRGGSRVIERKPAACG